MPQYPQVLFKNRKPGRVATLDEYRESGGYRALEKFIGDGISPGEIIRLVSESGLLGRGGAGFPAGKKWAAVPDSALSPLSCCKRRRDGARNIQGPHAAPC